MRKIRGKVAEELKHQIVTESFVEGCIVSRLAKYPDSG
ncbi:hypothetical protein Trichorick_01607 (plasmid) [Candidatus Trichorickettsia mobilis]|nr:hypothetical protein Trichorick_01607 [Candidatus Trichorickettsia mobilis]